jgi:hypothetical protein
MGDLPAPEVAAPLAEDLGDEEDTLLNATDCPVSPGCSFPSGNAD